MPVEFTNAEERSGQRIRHMDPECPWGAQRRKNMLDWNQVCGRVLGRQTGPSHGTSYDLKSGLCPAGTRRHGIEKGDCQGKKAGG